MGNAAARDRVRLLVVLTGLLAVGLVLLVGSAGPASAAVCTAQWDGGEGTSSWHDASNWEADVVPVPADVVCIEPDAAVTVTYSAAANALIAELVTNANGSVSVTDGSIRVTGESVIGGDLLVSGNGDMFFGGAATVGGDLVWDGAGFNSHIGGYSPVSIAGELLWSGGVWDGLGPVTFNGGTISGSAPKYKYFPRNLTLESGTMTWTSGTLAWSSGGASFTIAEGATLDVAGDVLAGGNPGVLAVDGTLVKSAGTGTFTVDVDLVVGSSGTLRVESGKVKAGSVVLGGMVSSPFVGFVPGTCTVAPTILEWTSRSGVFATLDFPPLSGDLVWQARYGAAALTVSSRPAAGTSFTDVGGHWAEPQILVLADSCLTQGIGGGLYGPDDPVTRAQMAVFMIRALGIFDPPVPATDPFVDVPAGSWFGGFVTELVARNITQGIGEGLYGPDQSVTRAQMATFLARALGVPEPPIPTEDPFPDVPADHWAARFVQWVADEGITVGYGDGTFQPDRVVSRAEMAVFLGRAWDLDG